MKTQARITLLTALIAGAAVFTAGCSDSKNQSMSAKTDRAADKVVAATEKAGDKVAAVTEKAGDKIAVAGDKAAVAIDDTAITTKVKGAVLAEPGLKTLAIEVDTKDGVVTLSGTVESSTLKDRATQIAKNVEGVRSVVDNLVIKAT